MTELSVVLITRNEAANIARLLESVLRDTPGSSAEIVVVDSASTDATTAIASDYPVDVLRLDPDQPLSAAAGRHVGFRWTTGTAVLFLDGDMELHHGWLERGLRILAERPDVAGVTGALIERPGHAGGGSGRLLRLSGEPLGEVPFASGAGLYRRDVLDEVGCFHPFLRSDEEPELGLRIRHAGYRVLETEYPIAFHHSPPRASLTTVVGRWRRGLFLGAGQNLRLLRGTPLFWPYVRERGFGIVPLLVALAGLASALASLVSRRRRWMGGWASLVGVALAADVARRRGDISGTAYMVLQRLLIADGTVRGLLLPPHPPDRHPARYTVLQTMNHHQR